MSRLPSNFDPFDLTGCFIAGGAVLSAVTKNPIADYDIYPKNEKGREEVITTLLESNCFIVNISDRAITFKSNILFNKDGTRMLVQVMILDLFPTAQSIFDFFDFTVCMAAYDCDTKQYIFHDDFYPDIASKTLRFNSNTKFPLASMIRVNKYRNKGYYISKFEDAKIALTIAKTGLPTSWDQLETQIGGVYGRELKLQTDKIEFSYENAIKILSEFDQLSTTDNLLDKEYSDIVIEDILNCFITDNVQYVEVNDMYNCFVTDGFFIGERFNKELFDKMGKPKNFTHSKVTKFFGYVASSTSYQDSYSHIKSDKNSCTPYLNQTIKLVSYDIKDITSHNMNYVMAKAHIEKVVTKDTEMVDDVVELLSEKIHG